MVKISGDNTKYLIILGAIFLLGLLIGAGMGYLVGSLSTKCVPKKDSLEFDIQPSQELKDGMVHLNAVVTNKDQRDGWFKVVFHCTSYKMVKDVDLGTKNINAGDNDTFDGGEFNLEGNSKYDCSPSVETSLETECVPE